MSHPERHELWRLPCDKWRLRNVAFVFDAPIHTNVIYLSRDCTSGCIHGIIIHSRTIFT